ncbi:MAG: 16S rRNA processing protein RimM [Desulfobacteraceae bacterium]|nr:MAG: 16S rRNA processing protein RimM [Desulfobacteraceae bacterium]
MDKSSVLPIGKIVGVHGMKGYLKVFSFDESSDLFDPGNHLTLKHPDGKIQTVIVEDIQAHKNIIRMAVEGINDRTDAETLIGAEILINRSELPEPEEGSWYWCDLIGLAVYASDETYLGQIENLFETGSNDVIVVKREGTEILIPVLKSIICSVDFEEKKMIVDLPEGL